MWRSFPTQRIQSLSHRLRNDLCRLKTPDEMARVSSHLRNFAVGEVIGFIGVLDGHPDIGSGPSVAKGPAAFQQTRGSYQNPLTHVAPSNLLLNGENLLEYFASAEARMALERVFGMGVMAPDDWENQGDFTQGPRQNNVVDNNTERYKYGGGLVAAFMACGEEAVRKGRWDQSGKRRYNQPALLKFIEEIYAEVWVPKAKSAYRAAETHFMDQLVNAAQNDPALAARVQQRLKILKAQLEILNKEETASSEVANNVWKFTLNEMWPGMKNLPGSVFQV